MAMTILLFWTGLNTSIVWQAKLIFFILLFFFSNLLQKVWVGLRLFCPLGKPRAFYAGLWSFYFRPFSVFNSYQRNFEIIFLSKKIKTNIQKIPPSR